MKTKIDIALLDLELIQIQQNLITNTVVTLLVGVVVAPIFGVPGVTLWVVAGVLINFARMRAINAIKTKQLVIKDYESTLKKMQFFVFLSGLHWGAAALFFLDPEYPYIYLFVAVTILALVAASLSGRPAIPRLWLTFTYTLFAFVTLQMLILGNWLFALISIIFLYGLWILSKKISKRISESVVKDIKNSELFEEVKLAKGLLEQASLEKSRFMAAASHDLRQPLHAQGLLLEALKGHLTEDTQKELVMKISNSNEALNSLFSSLLEISQLDANTIRVNHSHQPFTSLCQEVLDEFEALAQQKNVDLRLVGKHYTIISDPVLLKRIIRNLISNALKYTPSGGVKLQIDQAKEIVSLSVIDTGIGIPESKHEMIFKEYFQLNNDARDRNKGVGLGLALVQRMCKLLEHTISLESSLGKGSLFKLTLPLGDPKKVMTMVDEPKLITSIEGLTILVIDNEQPILDALKALENLWSCSFQLFSSIERAESFARNSDIRPNVIISDYHLADNNTGIDAINRLRALYKADIPAALISGDTSADLMNDVRRNGFYMLHKPIKANKLRTVVSILMSNKSNKRGR